MARGRGRGRGRGGGRGRGRGRPDADGDGSDESGEEFEERPKMGISTQSYTVTRWAQVTALRSAEGVLIAADAVALGGQSATAGMLPPSDSDEEETAKPAAEPKGQVCGREPLLCCARMRQLLSSHSMKRLTAADKPIQRQLLIFCSTSESLALAFYVLCA